MATEEELRALSSSDLSVEEKLAAGASVDDLISAGVLHDDYPAGYEFTTAEDVAERERQIAFQSPPSSEEIDLLKRRLRWGGEVHRLGKDASPRPF